MTLGEVIRAIESSERVRKTRLKEKANFDYISAILIGRSVARVHNSANTMPKISDVYPELFEEETLQAKKDEISAIRFELFAQSYNSRYKGVSKTNG